MKNLLKFLFVSTVIITSSCSTDNFDQEITNINTSESFAARFVNDSTSNVDLTIYDINGNIMSASHDIRPGKTINFSSLNSKEATFVIATETSDRIVALDIEENNAYYVILNEDKDISTLQTARL